jgi:phosphoglycerate dehydrogenase-like enzyme
MLLAIVRGLPAFAREQRDHVFTQFGRHIPTTTLYGKRMLIVGMGNIGTAIARRALAFEMTVTGLIRDDPGYLGEEMTLLPVDEHLDNELQSTDVLVIAVPYTAETDGLIDARRIGLLPDGAIVIGISRGRIIDEAALAARLHDGTLAGAGLDVFAEEPLPPDHFLWDAPNLIITPHAAPNSPLTKDREFEITIENVRRFIAGEPLLNTCDKVAGF